MPNTIIENLPAIHATLIGVGAAFFSAFSIFAYQKIQEAKDELDSIFEEIKSFSTPHIIMGSVDGKNSIVENGELNWDVKAKELLYHARSFFYDLDIENKYGPTTERNIRHQDPDKIFNTCHSLCAMFYYLFSSYPFQGNSFLKIAELTDTAKTKNTQAFDREQINEIEKRIGFLYWFWSQSNQSLLALGRTCTKIQNERDAQDEQDSYRRFCEEIARDGDLPEEQKQKMWLKLRTPRISNAINYEQIIVEYFNKIILYQEKFLPQLKNVFNIHQRYNERLNFKFTTKYAIKAFFLIFIFGIVLPMLLINFNHDFGLEWLPFLEYVLLFTTMAPYLWICRYFYKKVSALSFR